VWRRLGFVVLAVGFLGGCHNDWRTDMWYQPSVGPEDSPRPQPANSVPLGAAPPLADRDDAEDLRDPVPASPESLAHGKMLFEQRCACCHGAAGHGGGPVSKFFPPAPDLAYATIKARSDGFIFGTIAFGGRAMPPQGDGLTPQDRWDLVNWVRHVQGAEPEGQP
jgi:mono/diheme cytochrome c family protein